ncbi:type II secretion system F family protein [Methylobacterium nonmethylotrophicum]|uniref:Type II secretion system F family protein n=1 Tax=Methylobacterium nonmethylotrophicum TaxID=1141884 RepID=A0A4Z0NV45_9HYPH|nr:type II secretion system F family protein [Methylobacterium nonmethylotrophicum]TGE01037.1 type II secretion system F family protein [Methylobacterium nonmethylotrophicum]
MPCFRFHAVDPQNRPHDGLVEAPSRDAALADLAGRGLTIIAVAATAPGRGTGAPGSPARAWRAGLGSNRPPTPRETHSLIAEWARCLEAGLTIADAVEISAEGRPRARLGRTTRAIQAALKQGAPVGQALADNLPHLPPAALSLIESGERSGELAAVLSRLAARLSQQQQQRGEIRSALVYPAFVVTTALTVIIVLLQIVIPSLDEIVGDGRDTLPWTAQLVLAASAVFRDHVVALAAAALLLALGTLGLVIHPAARPLLDRARLRLPMIGPLMLAHDAAQFARALSAQIGGGVPIGRAVQLAVAALSLEPIRSRAGSLERKLAEGSALSDAIASDLPDLPRELARFARVGEQTSRLPLLLEHAADLLEERGRRQLRTLTNLVTPTVTVLLGFLVGFVVLSLMSAIVGLNAVALR